MCIRDRICSGGIPQLAPIGMVTVIMIIATTMLIVKFVTNTVIITVMMKKVISEILENTGVKIWAKKALMPVAGNANTVSYTHLKSLAEPCHRCE